jgi:hypothetical protein
MTQRQAGVCEALELSCQFLGKFLPRLATYHQPHPDQHRISRKITLLIHQVGDIFVGQRRLTIHHDQMQSN